MTTIKIESKTTKMIAHRGLSALETENTCSSFVAAGNRTYFGIETDLRRTKDGEYVTFHDDSMLRLADKDVSVNQLSYEKITEIILKDKDGTYSRKDLRVPSLQNYINICKKYDKVAILELKQSFSREHIKEILDIIISLNYLDKVIFIAFDINNLLLIREFYPNQKVQFLTSSESDDYIDILIKNKMDVDIYWERLTEVNVKKLKSAGIEINCWTCNDEINAEKLINLGVDYITSDILE